MPNYLNQLKNCFYWPSRVVTFRFTAPEQATDLGGAHIVARALTESQKMAARAGFAQWQATLATNPSEAQREFTEVGTGQHADIEIVVVPKNYFPRRNVLGLTQSAWRSHKPRPELAHVVIWMREGLSDMQFAYVMLHEQGHAILSADHCREAGSILFATVPLRPCKAIVSEADANTIREHYRRLSAPL